MCNILHSCVQLCGTIEFNGFTLIPLENKFNKNYSAEVKKLEKFMKTVETSKFSADQLFQ